MDDVNLVLKQIDAYFSIISFRGNIKTLLYICTVKKIQ